MITENRHVWRDPGSVLPAPNRMGGPEDREHSEEREGKRTKKREGKKNQEKRRERDPSHLRKRSRLEKEQNTDRR